MLRGWAPRASLRAQELWFEHSEAKKIALLCGLEIIEMDLLSTPWRGTALLRKMVTFTTRLESPSVPAAVNVF